MYGSSAATAAAMTSESHHHHHHHHQGSGLIRYRSAPTSLLSELCEDFLPVNRPPSSPETDAMLFARFLSSDLRDEHPRSSAAATASGSGQRNPQLPPQPPPPPPAAQEENRIGTSMGFPSAAAASASEMMTYQQLQNQNGGGNVCSNLIRHSSSPAGFFSHLNVLENGFEVMRGINHEFKGQGQLMSFSSKQRQSSSSAAAGLMPQILDIENESIGIGGGGGGGYHPMASWGEEEDDDNIFSALLNDNNNDNNNNKRPRRRRDDNQTQLNTTRNREARNDGSRLAHHLSLPMASFSSEMAAIDNFLQFQDSVPCKIRAKRGCATHPRSIAERVRRTRISERMKKLQELVPNMDKQTNTADMLDLSVDYIKDLQEQVKTLTNKRAGCTCSSSSNKQNQFSGLAV